MKDISKLLRFVSIVAIGITAIGACVNEAAARDKTEMKGTDVGRTASSYRKPLKIYGTGSPRHRSSRLPKESGGKVVNIGHKSATPQ